VKRFIDAGRNCEWPLVEALGGIGKSFDDFDRVLDFGCGCGRVFQHVHKRCKCDLYGCDVDGEAIRWMQRAFANATFKVNASDPPLPFGAEQFDLVFSVSVFTHLDEANQFAWLRELNRVMRVGGMALLTVTGAYGMEKLRRKKTLSPIQASLQQSRRSLAEEGFLYQEKPDTPALRDSRRGRGISGDWGLARHSKAYIRVYWSRFFDVVDIREGVIDSVQDLVVLKKRHAEGA